METQELTKTHKNDFAFITEIIQRGRIKPAKFIHSLTIPYWLYEEMRNKGNIKPEVYYTYDTAFFEFRHERVVISFVARCLCDDLQFVIDRYLIVEFMGKYPIVRTCSSKMNNDKPNNLNAGIETNKLVNQMLNKVNGTGKSKYKTTI